MVQSAAQVSRALTGELKRSARSALRPRRRGFDSGGPQVGGLAPGEEPVRRRRVPVPREESDEDLDQVSSGIRCSREWRGLGPSPVQRRGVIMCDVLH